MINLETAGIIEANLQESQPWSTEQAETAARLVFGACYQSLRYAWQQDIIDNNKATNALWNTRPSTTVDGRKYVLSDEEIQEQSESKERILSTFYQDAIMQSLTICAEACGRNVTPGKGIIIPKGLYGNTLLRTTEKSIREELCGISYGQSIVLFGPENVDEAIRQNVMWDGLSDKLKSFLGTSGAIAVIARDLNLADTGASLERYYGDKKYEMWQSPNDQEMLRRNNEIRRAQSS